MSTRHQGRDETKSSQKNDYLTKVTLLDHISKCQGQMLNGGLVEFCKTKTKWPKLVDSLKTCPKFVLSRNSRRFSTCWESIPRSHQMQSLHYPGNALLLVLSCFLLQNFIVLQTPQIQMQILHIQIQILSLKVWWVHKRTQQEDSFFVLFSMFFYKQ